MSDPNKVHPVLDRLRRKAANGKLQGRNPSDIAVTLEDLLEVCEWLAGVDETAELAWRDSVHRDDLETKEHWTNQPS